MKEALLACSNFPSISSFTNALLADQYPSEEPKTKLMEFLKLNFPLPETISVPFIVWFGRMVSVGNLKLSQLPNTRLPSFWRVSLVVFRFPVVFPGHKFRRDEFKSWSSPEEEMVKTAEPSTVEVVSLTLADQTTSLPVTFWYQMEKV